MFSAPTFLSHILAVDNAVTNQDKGSSLESLSRYLFNCIDGIEVREVNINAPAEEVDLLLWNAKTTQVFEPWDNLISIECKNWSRPAGATLIDSFAAKIRMKHLTTGIFVAANGVTGDFVNGNNEERGAVYRLHEHLTRDGIRIVVVRMDDLRALSNINDFLEIIKD
ncbi:restriction endonuclease, partial [Cronobacter sakazakii]|uniref:restriction endonuclease n=2 Tax=Enterobacterales TaxID=91347 RepID=UPI00117870CF